MLGLGLSLTTAVGRGPAVEGAVVDPAFIVTLDGVPVTHNGAVVTIATLFDPETLVMHEGAVVTSGGMAVTHGG